MKRTPKSIATIIGISEQINSNAVVVVVLLAIIAKLMENMSR